MATQTVGVDEGDALPIDELQRHDVDHTEQTCVRLRASQPAKGDDATEGSGPR